MSHEPRVAILADAGERSGLGHLRRCMTLGTELRARGCEVTFLVPPTPVAGRLLARDGFNSRPIEMTSPALPHETAAAVRTLAADWLIIDSYRIVDVAAMRVAARTGVVDDLADRWLPVDVVINPGVAASGLAYQVAPETRLLLGIEYALLRSAFRDRAPRSIAERVSSVLITVGGTDEHRLLPRLLAWTRTHHPGAAIDVLVGPFVDDSSSAAIAAATGGGALVQLHDGSTPVWELMQQCDLAVTGGGQTTYELAATGTPAIGIELAANQRGNLEGLERLGTLMRAGAAADVALEQNVVGCFDRLAGAAARRALSDAGRAVVDGFGAVRVAERLIGA